MNNNCWIYDFRFYLSAPPAKVVRRTGVLVLWKAGSYFPDLIGDHLTSYFNCFHPQLDWGWLKLLFDCISVLNIYVSIVADAEIVLFDGLRTEYKAVKIIKINIIEVIKMEYIFEISISPERGILNPGMKICSKINVIGPHGIKYIIEGS